MHRKSILTNRGDAEVGMDDEQAADEPILRWPSGDISPLIPISGDQFIDRSYWEVIALEQDASHNRRVRYGRFQGKAVPPD